jgi:hypothetical protein
MKTVLGKSVMKIAFLLLFLAALLPGCESAPTLPDNLFPPPWSNVNYYFDANETIIAKVGEEFTIGFDTFERGGGVWRETHDEKVISLVDSQKLAYPPAFNPATTWFLFKALQSGDTQITFKYYLAVDQFQEQRIFNIEIEED